ncbi:MAG: RNA polymerase sporulation sigma factor SigE [Peptococcaceae bacterium]|nr:RNA polymerase sporulation sigma factor SigE [Peptococcaceae bacterium]
MLVKNLNLLRLRSWLAWLRLLHFFGVPWLPRAVHFVGSSEALPPPLSEEEEHYLIERLKGGDLAVKSVLVERNLRLVVYIARKFENTGLLIEDLVSIGSIGLIKAVNTFNPTRNIKLATYASRCIENEILMYLRRNQKNKVEVSLDEPLNVDWDGNELLLSDVIPVENSEVYRGLEAEVDRTMLETAIGKLNRREQHIMQLRFGLHDGRERTQKEVADILSISQSYISRLEKRILTKLKREFKRME